MSTFARVLAEIEAAGPAGIRTDVLAERLGCSQDLLKVYLKRHREKGREVRCLHNGCTPARVFARRDWYEAAEILHDAAVKARRNAQKRADRARQASAMVERRKRVVVWRPPVPVQKPPQEPAGALPEPTALPSQPVYSRHQLAALPPGFRSQLDPADCRPWARAAGQR